MLAYLEEAIVHLLNTFLSIPNVLVQIPQEVVVLTIVVFLTPRRLYKWSDPVLS